MGPVYGIIVDRRMRKEHAVGAGHMARAMAEALLAFTILSKETMWAHGILALQ